MLMVVDRIVMKAGFGLARINLHQAIGLAADQIGVWTGFMVVVQRGRFQYSKYSIRVLMVSIQTSLFLCSKSVAIELHSVQRLKSAELE